MDRVFVFLIRNDIWIYIVSALGLFWYLSEFIRARRSLRSAVFGIERERGTRKRNNAFFFVLLFTTIIASVIYVNQRIAPDLPPELLRPPTPTPNPLNTPLARPSPLGTPATARPMVTPDLAPTVTLIGQPGAVVEPENEYGDLPTATATLYVPPTPFVDCTADLNISEPRDGSSVGANISFYGTAETENFGSFVLETNGPQTNGQWASLLGREVDTPVSEGFLGTVNLSNWSNGPYLIRLTTMDTQGNITGSCVIQVTMSGSS
jgi:hypothetical protein